MQKAWGEWAMIYDVDLSPQRESRALFAFDAEDLERKRLAMGTTSYASCIYWNESQAVGAFEGHDPRIASDEHWLARRALYEQLVALEVLADDC